MCLFLEEKTQIYTVILFFQTLINYCGDLLQFVGHETKLDCEEALSQGMQVL